MFETTFLPTDGYWPDGPLADPRTTKAKCNSRPATCTACAVRRSCIAQGLERPEVEMLDDVVQSTRVIRQGGTLFRAGDEFRSIYAVRLGSFKTVVTHRHGMEQVAGFSFTAMLLASMAFTATATK